MRRSSSARAAGHRQGGTRLNRDDAVQFPSPDSVLSKSSIVGEFRQVVDFVGHKNVRPVDIRVATIQTGVSQVSYHFLVRTAG